jgi:hypothetical protein
MSDRKEDFGELDEQLLTDYVAERERQETLRSEAQVRRFWSFQLM